MEFLADGFDILAGDAQDRAARHGTGADDQGCAARHGFLADVLKQLIGEVAESRASEEKGREAIETAHAMRRGQRAVVGREQERVEEDEF